MDPYLHILLDPRYEGARPALLLIVGLTVLRLKLGRRGRPRSAEKRQVNRKSNSSLWQRYKWWRDPPADLMKVDGLVIDRTRRPHCAWLGPTGGGKSASVATVRVNGERPTFIVTPDISDPLFQAGDMLEKFLHWRAGDPKTCVNFLIGTATEVAQRLTEVFRSGGMGTWKRTARMWTAQVIREIDAEGIPRTLIEIGARLQKATRHDKNLALVCDGWISRFLDLADQFGASIGAGGVDLAELLKQGYTILLDNDAFKNPGLVEDIVALGLAEAKRCADKLRNGFRLIFEEAGQIGERIELAAPFFRAGRRRKIMVDVLTQAESDLKFRGSDAITANLGTRVYFSQEEISLQKAAADRLGFDYSELDPSTMDDFTAWLAHGRIRRLIRFPKPKPYVPYKRAVSHGLSRQHRKVYTWPKTEPGVKKDPGGNYWVEEVEPDRGAGSEKPDRGPLALPAAAAIAPVWIAERGPRKEERRGNTRLDVWLRLSGTWNEQGDQLWTGGQNKGYGKTSYVNVSGWATHFLFWAWKAMWDHEHGLASDLERFYSINPDVPRFVWPESTDELVVLRALKIWMARPDPGREKLSLSVDHCCPGYPNALCGNWRHHQLVADEPGREGSNSKLRWQRRRGDGRLKAEAVG